MKQHLLFLLFFAVMGHSQAQKRSLAIVQIGSERGMYWGNFSPYIGAQYQYVLITGIHLNIGLGYVNDRIKAFGGSYSEFHHLRSIQPYAGLQMTFPVINRHNFSAGLGLKLIALRLNYINEVIEDALDPDIRTVRRRDYNVNQPVSTFSIQHDYYLSERLFAGLQLQLDYLLQREDLQSLFTGYYQTRASGPTSVYGYHSPRSLGRFTLRMGYKF